MSPVLPAVVAGPTRCGGRAFPLWWQRRQVTPRRSRSGSLNTLSRAVYPGIRVLCLRRRPVPASDLSDRHARALMAPAPAGRTARAAHAHVTVARARLCRA